MNWKMLTATVIRHWCHEADRLVMTLYFEERCPYCKHAPPERPPAVV